MAGGLHPPPEVIHTWPRPNYLNPEETRGWEGPIINIVLCALAFVVASLRLYARFFILKSAGVDDYLIALNLFPLFGLTLTLVLAVKAYKFDRHVWDIPLDDLATTRHVVLAIELLYVVSTALTKLSILLFYRRLSTGGVTPTLRRLAQASFIFVAVSAVFFLIYPFWSCTPFKAFFLQVDPRWFLANVGKWSCQNELTHFLTNGSISVVQDFIAVGIPFVIFPKLTLPRRQKILLGAIFLLGFCVCVVGILRLIAIARLYTSTYDITWYTQGVWIWTGVEANAAVICASLPYCRVYITRFIVPSIRTWKGSLFSDRTRPSIHDSKRAHCQSGGSNPHPSHINGENKDAESLRALAVVHETNPTPWDEMSRVTSDAASRLDSVSAANRSDTLSATSRLDKLSANPNDIEAGRYIRQGIRVDEDVIPEISRPESVLCPNNRVEPARRIPSPAQRMDSIELRDWDQRLGFSPMSGAGTDSGASQGSR